jgi:hypothetical protein
MYHQLRLGLAALAVGGALLAPSAALAAGTTTGAREGHHAKPAVRALHDVRRADRLLDRLVNHPDQLKHPDKAVDRVLTLERRADRLLDEVGVKDPRLDAARDELREAERAIDNKHPEVAEQRLKNAERLLDEAIKQLGQEVGG